MRHLMESFDKRTKANLLATALLHIILAIFTAAGLTKLSPVRLLLHLSKQQKKKHALLYYGNKLLPLSR